MLTLLLLAACGTVSSDEEAELAALGLEDAIERAVDLGFDGFHAADSANISPQTGEGEVSGTLTVSGQVDQGASDNKNLRLDLLLEDYADLVDLDLEGSEDDDEDEEDFTVTYWTNEDPGLPYLELKLRDLPDGELSGTLYGSFEMEGDLEGMVELDLVLSGPLEPDGEGDGRPVDDAVIVTGTATGPRGGVYEVDTVF